MSGKTPLPVKRTVRKEDGVYDLEQQFILRLPPVSHASLNLNRNTPGLVRAGLLVHLVLSLRLVRSILVTQVLCIRI